MAEAAGAGLWGRLTGGGRWRTVPNAITAARIALLPVVLALLAQRWFLAAVAVAALVFLSDFVDGFIARRFDQASALGRWLDPVADRATIIAVAIGMAWGGILPPSLVVLAMLPDALLALVAGLFFQGTPNIPVSIWGKARTALQFTAFFLLLLSAVLGELGIPSPALIRVGLLVFGIAIVASVIAGMLYGMAGARILVAATPRGNESPVTSPRSPAATVPRVTADAAAPNR